MNKQLIKMLNEYLEKEVGIQGIMDWIGHCNCDGGCGMINAMAFQTKTIMAIKKLLKEVPTLQFEGTKVDIFHIDYEEYPYEEFDISEIKPKTFTGTNEDLLEYWKMQGEIRKFKNKIFK